MNPSVRQVVSYIALSGLFYVVFTGKYASIVANDQPGGGIIYILSYNLSWVIAFVLVGFAAAIFSKRGVLSGAVIGTLVVVPWALWLVLFRANFGGAEDVVSEVARLLLVVVPALAFILSASVAWAANKLRSLIGESQSSEKNAVV